MTMSLTEANRAAVWGDLFEVGVKRGVLAHLRHARLLPEHPHLEPWRTRRVVELHQHLHEQLGATDPNERELLASSLEQLLLQGWGLGWTVGREVLARSGASGIDGLFCPLALRDRRGGAAPDRESQLAAFWAALALPGRPREEWAATGQPANADFLAVLRRDGEYLVLVLEFSLHAPPRAADFGEEGPHLEQLRHLAARLEGRGVFTRLGASVVGEGFRVGRRLISHLPALTTRDKPLYKLCQGASYAATFLERCADRYPAAGAQVVAITNEGLEAVAATFRPEPDLRATLVRELGRAYRTAVHLPDDDPAALDREIAAARREVARALPRPLREPLLEALDEPDPLRPVDVWLEERLTGFANPADAADAAALLTGVDEDDPIVRRVLGPGARERLGEAVRDRAEGAAVTLRDVHAAAIEGAIAGARPGELTVLAAEGLPGVGKTTAVRRALRAQPGGFLWLYASPRLVINDSVTREVARTEGTDEPTGTLALTTYKRLIDAARLVGRREGGGYVSAAVVADGVAGLVEPRGSIRFCTPEEADRLDAEHGSGGLRKAVIGERLDRIEAPDAPGVLGTLATAAREALAANPSVDRVVLTAAVQGFRRLTTQGQEAQARSTVQRLSELFRRKASTPAGREERRALAARIPAIVVMVDEIAGDGAGAPFVHEVAAWLQLEFIEPFRAVGQPGPFRVVLVLADASLANETVLGAYLAHREEAPEMVLVGSSAGPRAFRVAGTHLRLGGVKVPVLHVMADGFPARTLELAYRLRLDPLRPAPGPDGATPPARRAVRDAFGERLLRTAVEEIFSALERLPPDQQVICFAQDRAFLRDIRAQLLQAAPLAGTEAGAVDTGGVCLREQDVGLLDSSVRRDERRRLIRPEVRDRKRVFLMTSSGARGVSFPRATTIIAFVPPFSVESGFMEIAQLIYRGRGRGIDPTTGAPASGDGFDRRLVLLLHDVLVTDEAVDERQWLRRTLDLVSALVLLRATIFTRVTGDAAIPGQRASVVPVGRIGTDELVLSLAQAVERFAQESSIFLRDGVPPDQRALVQRAANAVLERFRNSRWTGHLPHRERRSVSSPPLLASLAARVCAEVAPLLEADGGASLPDQAYCVGPLWLERWDDVRSEEAFEIAAGTAAAQQGVDELRRRLGAIARAHQAELPETLRRSARDVLELLARPGELDGRTFSVEHRVDSARAWVALPLAYHRFCGPDPDTGQSPVLEEPDLWLSTLRRVVSAAATPTATAPVLPAYADRPFLVLLTNGDPTGLDRVFDDRYFMASAELNLLNTILFVGDEAAP
jgi:hypothetical protein